MNEKFDELARNMAQSVTRRVALKKFGTGLVAIAVASLGLANTASARRRGKHPPGCGNCNNCVYPYGQGACYYTCYSWCNGTGGP